MEELGANMINDISGGLIDPDMHRTVARLKVPYILMHMRGTPADMQTRCDYPDGVTASVIDEISAQLSSLEQLGVADIIIDPGFGFSKTLEQNYTLMHEMHMLTEAFGRPLLVGISRKSMLTRLLDIMPADALCPTVSLNTIALLEGAAILRVHDVLEARQAVKIVETLINR